MYIGFDRQKLHENLKRQGKRFAELLNLPLTDAQFMLAKHVYQEKSFTDVKSKIETGDFSGRIYLSAVGPDADKAVIERFILECGELLVVLQSSEISMLYDGSARDLLLNLFGLNASKLEMRN